MLPIILTARRFYDRLGTILYEGLDAGNGANPILADVSNADGRVCHSPFKAEQGQEAGPLVWLGLLTLGLVDNEQLSQDQ